MRLNDLSGRSFGSWTVLRRSGTSGRAGSLWVCSCACGTERVILSGNLTKGLSKSCGCYGRARSSEVHLEDLTGMTFGRLSVVRREVGHRVRWVCECSCGGQTVAAPYSLKSGRTKSCGCLQKERTSKATRSHGLSKTRTYSIWAGMRCRCENPNNRSFHNYGGRGIQVSQEWLKFETFFRDMGSAPQGKTLDRVNNDEGYSKGNCRWATKKEQARNRRTNMKVKHEEGSVCLSELCEKEGLSYKAEYARRRRPAPREGSGGKP